MQAKYSVNYLFKSLRYRAFFHGIVGFFVCEDHVLNTGNGLVSRGHLDEVKE